jgi:hypothetical protein
MVFSRRGAESEQVRLADGELMKESWIKKWRRDWLYIAKILVILFLVLALVLLAAFAVLIYQTIDAISSMNF